MRRASLIFLFFLANAWAKPNPLVGSAEASFSQYDYPQAFHLWTEILAKDSTNDAAALQVANLQFFFEGRQAARDGLARHFLTRGDSMPRESRRNLLSRWRVLQSSFLTEEGQSLFLQAGERAAQGDLPAAVALNGRALALEKGNLELIRFRARCEWKLENFSAHYESLKQAHAEFPFDPLVQQELAEAHLRFQQPQRVVEMWEKDSEAFSLRKRLALVFAYLDTGNESKAAALMVRPSEAKLGTPPAWNFLYGALAARRGSPPEAFHYWSNFLAQLEKKPPPVSDAYRLADRAGEVRAWIARKAALKNAPPVTKNVS